MPRTTTSSGLLVGAPPIETWHDIAALVERGCSARLALDYRIKVPGDASPGDGLALDGVFGVLANVASIAVMPFVNESGDADVEYLSDGMTETLIAGLSQLPNLSVKARSSVFRYKGRDTDPQTIGHELSVKALLIGRIVQRGDRLVISAELVDVEIVSIAV